MGKYTVSSLPRPQSNGRFRAGVSIRSGSGSATTDRVMHFSGDFDSEAAAHRHAHQQGLNWVSSSGSVGTSAPWSA